MQFQVITTTALLAWACVQEVLAKKFNAKCSTTIAWGMDWRIINPDIQNAHCEFIVRIAGGKLRAIVELARKDNCHLLPWQTAAVKIWHSEELFAQGTCQLPGEEELGGEIVVEMTE